VRSERLLSRHAARTVVALGKRSTKQTLRRPQLMAPLIIFPTLLLAIQSAGAGRAVDLPGFPEVQSFLAFMLAGAMIQATMLAGNTGGIALAVDIEMGFTDRLLAAPIPRFAIVLGRLAGTAALGLITAVWFLAIGFIFGVRFEEGALGVLLMVVLVVGSAIAFGSIGAAIALRSGSASVVQGLFPLIFVILFLSTAFFPQDLLLEPARTIAEYNPLSFIVNAVRDPVVFSFSADDLLKGLLGLTIVGAVGTMLAARALRHRLRVG
jgi:ABC-2 type transport system permease protein